MRYATVCSGIETPTVAWKPLGWEAVWFSEIDAYKSSLLKHYYPAIPNVGDMTTITERINNGTISADFRLLAGGTPCPSFSVVGNRKGMDDERGYLAMHYISILDRAKPTWFLWENVPGVLSANGGKDFSTFIGSLVEIGYGVAYRVLNAEYFGVPQSRHRVFVLGFYSNWRPPAAVLFNKECMSGYTSPSRKAWSNIRCFTESRFGGYREGVGTVRKSGGSAGSGTENIIIYENHSHDGRFNKVDKCPTVTKHCGTGSNNVPFVRHGGLIRKMTPVEAERFMGLDDNYTEIPFGKSRTGAICPDSRRYAACGDSIPVPMLSWLGRRIDFVDSVVRNTEV